MWSALVTLPITFIVIYIALALTFEDKVVLATHAIQTAFPQTRPIWEMPTMFFEALRNFSSVLPNKTLFYVLDWLIKFNMKCMMSGPKAGPSPPGRVVKVVDDVYLVCNINLYFFADQISETVILIYDETVFFLGIGNIRVDVLKNLVGNRDVVVLLNFEHHHNWLTLLMDQYPGATITGCRKAFDKHTHQRGKSYTYTPPDKVQWPDDLVCFKFEGVADEEYGVLHKKYKMLFTAHFYSHPVYFAGASSQWAIMKPIIKMMHAAAQNLRGWNDWATDNPVLDREANELCKQKVMAHGGWTTVHASHAGFIIYPKFEDLDVNDDGKVTKEDIQKQMGPGWTTRFCEMDADNDGFVTMQEYAAMHGARTPSDGRYRSE